MEYIRGREVTLDVSDESRKEAIRDVWCTNGGSCDSPVCATNGCRLGYDTIPSDSMSPIDAQDEVGEPEQHRLKVLSTLNISVR